MRARRLLAVATISVAVVTQGCVAEPMRIFYDDTDADAATTVDATTGSDSETEGAGQDSSPQNGDSDGFNEGAQPAADGAVDSAHDAGADSAIDATSDSASDVSVDAEGDAPSGSEGGCGTTNTIENCATCGSACDTLHSAGASCNGVSCLYSGCVSGWGDCVTLGPPNTDGCETPLNSLTNCTGCGLTCDSVHSIGPSCDGGSCGYMRCAPGYADCVTSVPDTDGCETPINTPTNCTGCGLACDTAHSVGAQCTATGCTYSQCATGWSNCDTTAPDTAGCECSTPICCGTSCQTAHDNGVGNAYYDCLSLGTYTQSQAMKACTAYTGDASQCVQYTCMPSTYGPIICSAGAMFKNCICWSYAGNDVGYVDNAGGPPGSTGSNCFCPNPASDPMWN